MMTCGMYDATGVWVTTVGMPAKSGVGGGIIAVLPSQLGIGVYSPPLGANGNSIRGVLACQSLSAQLGLHFLSVTRESRATIRATHDVADGVRIYELHGDLLFAGAEQALRIVEQDGDGVDVAILDLSRVDDINDVARRMLIGMREALNKVGKEGFLVDPDRRVIPADRANAAVYPTVEEAVAAARRP